MEVGAVHVYLLACWLRPPLPDAQRGLWCYSTWGGQAGNLLGQGQRGSQNRNQELDLEGQEGSSEKWEHSTVHLSAQKFCLVDVSKEPGARVEQILCWPTV